MEKLAKQEACQLFIEQEITYFISDEAHVKIGKTQRNVLNDRITALQTGNPRPLKLDIIILSNKEKFFHELFSNKRIHNEWFLLQENYIQSVKLLCNKNNWLYEEHHNHLPHGFFKFHILDSIVSMENKNA